MQANRPDQFVVIAQYDGKRQDRAVLPAFRLAGDLIFSVIERVWVGDIQGSVGDLSRARQTLDNGCIVHGESSEKQAVGLQDWDFHGAAFLVEYSTLASMFG